MISIEAPENMMSQFSAILYRAKFARLGEICPQVRRLRAVHRDSLIETKYLDEVDER